MTYQPSQTLQTLRAKDQTTSKRHCSDYRRLFQANIDYTPVTSDLTTGTSVIRFQRSDTSDHLQISGHAATPTTCSEHQDLILIFSTRCRQELLDSRVYTFDTCSNCIRYHGLLTPQRLHGPYSAAMILYTYRLFVCDSPNKNSAFKPLANRLCPPCLVRVMSLLLYKRFRDRHIYRS